MCVGCGVGTGVGYGVGANTGADDGSPGSGVGYGVGRGVGCGVGGVLGAPTLPAYLMFAKYVPPSMYVTPRPSGATLDPAVLVVVTVTESPSAFVTVAEISLDVHSMSTEFHASQDISMYSVVSVVLEDVVYQLSHEE